MWQCNTQHGNVPTVAYCYQWCLKPLIEEPLKVVSVNNRSVETAPPQKNKLAIFCFPCVVDGNSLSKEKWEGILLRLLFANSLCSQDRQKWLRKLKFIEIYFSGKVGCVSWIVERFLKLTQWVFGQRGGELLLWLYSEGGMCRFVAGGKLQLEELVIMATYRLISSLSCLKWKHYDCYSCR